MKASLLVLVFLVLAIFAQIRSSSSIVLVDLQRLECKTNVSSRNVETIFEPPPVPCCRNSTMVGALHIDVGFGFLESEELRKEYRSSLVYVQLDSDDAGSDCSDCVSRKAGASKVLCGSLYYRSHQRSRACSTPSTFSCCSTTPSFSVHNDDSLADLSSTSNMSFAALPAKLRAASSIPYISGGGGGRRKKQAKRGNVDEPSAEFQEQLQCFLSRSGRIKVVECGDGHCGIRCFVRHGNQAIGNEMHAANQSHVSGGRRALAEILLKHEGALIKLLSPFGLEAAEVQTRATLHLSCADMIHCAKTFMWEDGTVLASSRGQWSCSSQSI